MTGGRSADRSEPAPNSVLQSSKKGRDPNATPVRKHHRSNRSHRLARRRRRGDRQRRVVLDAEHHHDHSEHADDAVDHPDHPDDAADRLRHEPRAPQRHAQLPQHGELLHRSIVHHRSLVGYRYLAPGPRDPERRPASGSWRARRDLDDFEPVIPAQSRPGPAGEPDSRPGTAPHTARRSDRSKAPPPALGTRAPCPDR
jgi:hypothetical protein